MLAEDRARQRYQGGCGRWACTSPWCLCCSCCGRPRSRKRPRSCSASASPPSPAAGGRFAGGGEGPGRPCPRSCRGVGRRVVLLGGTLVTTFSGKHRDTGFNLQVAATLSGTCSQSPGPSRAPATTCTPGVSPTSRRPSSSGRAWAIWATWLRHAHRETQTTWPGTSPPQTRSATRASASSAPPSSERSHT